MCLLFGINSFAQDSINVKRDSISIDSNIVNYINVYKEIKKNNIKFADIVFCQSIIESGHYKSKIFKSNNNLFGMKHPKKRKSLSKGNKNGYASYNNWQESIKDYKIWQDINLHNGDISRNGYLNYLKRVYCGCPNYIKLINKVYNKYKFIMT